ncbi:MAG: 3-oxoacyl-ACP reductase [Alphaproteobacteria bacterium TMED87]|nr:3-oxoacyl-ACP reductase [Rhodospirillaceae bacterium]OUV11590.1 MAG: 3-oxoacyl-ACP reductase [Alphaproteobacteria bacterium TMED87]|tara:strand:- start:105 stop:1016 length:912 start_codon:yes stop_codon:yes gene_type:complete
MNAISFEGKVAIVTGAGNGLGKSHALELARRGAKVVVNDFGGDLDGTGSSKTAAETVAEEINKSGGEALANSADVSNVKDIDELVLKILSKWGRIDILVNNAGILRDKTFAKMEIKDFKAVVDVHLIGSAICTKAVWEPMREQKYGRVVFTSSSSGIYGNFGQSNYGAAKMGVLGLMNVLKLEGEKYNIKVNALSPTAATRMTEELLPNDALKLLTVESVTAGLIFLVSEEAPNRLILCAGAGGYAATRIYETDGIFLAPNKQSPEDVAKNINAIIDIDGQEMYEQGSQQTMKFATKASKGLK